MSAGPGVTRIVIVDDHTAFADALGLALNMTPDFECVATTTDPEATEELVRVTGAQMIVSDHHLGGGVTGLDLIGGLVKRHPHLGAVLLTGFPTPGVRDEAGRLGIVVLSKSMPMKEIVTALRAARDGEPATTSPNSSEPELLSASQRTVLELLGEGRRVADIADSLSITEHTVRDHVKAIRRKLGTSSQLEAVLEAQRRGLIAPPS